MNKYETYCAKNPVPVKRFLTHPQIEVIDWVREPVPGICDTDTEYPVITVETARMYAEILPGLRDINNRRDWLGGFWEYHRVVVTPGGLHSLG